MDDGTDIGARATAWRWGDYLLEPAQRRLLRCGVPVEVEDRTLDLLILLLQHQERALDKQEVIAAIWGKRPVGDATLRQLVFKARRAVGDDGERQRTISTLYGRSIQWVATVEAVIAQDLPAGPDVAVASGTAVPVEPGSVQAPVAAIAELPPAEASPDLRPAVRGNRIRMSPRMQWLVGTLCALVVVAAVVHIGDNDGWWQRASNPAPAPVTSGVTAAAAPSAPPLVIPASAATDAHATIAVLPFRGMDTKGASYLTDGITEELITRLGRFPDLRVAARTSSFVFRDKPVDIRDAARKLGVDNIVEGSVQRSGDRLRVRVALVGANDGFERWSAEYDPAAGDVLKVEDEIAASVLKALRPELGGAALAAARGVQASTTVDPAAHDFYLVGLQYLRRRTPADLEQAAVHFRKAVAASPRYAEAWAALAMVYAVTSDYKEIPPDTHYAEASAAVARALALDPNLARAHAVQGWLYEMHWQWPQARAEFERAVQLDPSDPTARQWYATYLWYTRDMGGALEQLRLAHQLDPLSPVINVNLARALLYAGHVDEGVAQFRSTIVAQPDYAAAHLLLGETLLGMKRNKEALQEVRTAIKLGPQPSPSTFVAALGVALKANGDVAGARAQYAALKQRSQKQFVSGVSLAWLSVELGDADGALKDLARAVDQHDPMTELAVNDSTAWWYNDPRIEKLRVRMQLPTKH